MPLLKRRKRTKVSIVGVIFHGRGRNYDFKTILPLELGEKVVVQTAQGLTIAEVFKYSNHNPKINYKWIVAKLNMKELERKHINNLKTLGIKY